MRSFVLCCLLVTAPLHAATKVSLCDLIADPAKYDRQILEITAFVSHGFEDFTLFDPRCPSGMTRVWLEYGGAGGDRRLSQFDRIVHATLRGRYFAGEKQDFPGGTFWVGYGHLGFFSLFAIEQVVSVDPHDLRDVDYRAHTDPPDAGADCVASSIAFLPYPDAIEQQRLADAGARAWAFTDPKRVAMERAGGAELQQVRQGQGRVTYRDARNKRWVVVSRPYWLTFFAAKRERVAWVAIAVYDWAC